MFLRYLLGALGNETKRDEPLFHDGSSTAVAPAKSQADATSHGGYSGLCTHGNGPTVCGHHVLSHREEEMVPFEIRV